jgi:sugar phosphate isomerase/epimerase
MADISRRNFFAGGAGAAAAGMAATAAGVAPSAASAAAGPAGRAALPDVWGQEFLYQWSPSPDFKRNLTPGPALIRLAGQAAPRLTNVEGTNYDAIFKGLKDAGWTAVEAGSVQWLNRKLPASEVAEIKRASAAHDVKFYNLHCGGNIIAPDPDADRWQRHIIDTVHAAEELGCPMILTHAGSMYPNRNTGHPLNWSREAWQRTVNALKRICRDTAGSKVEIAIEAVNTESVNNPWAQKRLREEVGDPRIMCGLDITNMVHPQVAFRMSEFTHETFDLLGDQIRYVHMKDFVWNSMLPGMSWAMNGTGNMDYELWLACISRLKVPEVYGLIEFLSTDAEYAQAQRNVRSIASKLGVKIHGTQPA